MPQWRDIPQAAVSKQNKPFPSKAFQATDTLHIRAVYSRDRLLKIFFNLIS
jgi:hypothetical protein